MVDSYIGVNRRMLKSDGVCLPRTPDQKERHAVGVHASKETPWTIEGARGNDGSRPD